ncbi:MAG: hypothetical protein LC772_01295 [Chloroflexi bacterium]|nr:hypothetical protein [Chloroflexota bacterium]
MGGRIALWTLLLVLVSALPASALPEFARRYGVSCEMCHSVPPHLNTFGMAFQANFFNWPGPQPPASRSLLSRIPLSVLAISSTQGPTDGNGTTTTHGIVRLFAASGFPLGANRRGGFFIDDMLINSSGTAGDLGNAFASLPFAGARGQFALSVGQLSPLMYEYDPVNSLTAALPGALADGVDAFTFTDPTPAVRLDFFDNRGRGTADGNYASLGVPFLGHLTTTNEAILRGSRGLFAHAFRRHGYATLGAFAYIHAGSSEAGLIGDRELRPNVILTGIAHLGHDDLGSHQRLSAEANFLPSSYLALTGRLEATAGDDSQIYPVAAVTYYPFHQHLIRLMAQTIQARSNHTAGLFIYGQL